MSELGADTAPQSDDNVVSEVLLHAVDGTLMSCDTSDHLRHDRDNETGYSSEDVASACNCSSSSSSTQHAARDAFDEEDVMEGAEQEEHDCSGHINYLESTRTSISSLPASVIVRPVSTTMHSTFGTTGYCEEELLPDHHPHGIAKNRNYGTLRSLKSFRQREAVFRKPSSVRAMQMHSEDEDEGGYLTPMRCRKGGGIAGGGVSMSSPHGQTKRMTSGTSVRSTGASPFRKSPYYLPSGIAVKPPPLKKEYPLVLLHCTLLAPALSLSGMLEKPSSKLLQEVLPARYWSRWKLLEEKLGSGVVRERGVLISHPQESYELLEERLLESLELQRPRLHNGHFLGQEEGASEEEDDDHRDAVEGSDNITDDENDDECPDCGTKLVKNQHSRRKWEVKVYAANGLMRAGAWAAAWKEMEKVDVEVGLWLLVELRRELEKKVLDQNRPEYQTQVDVSDMSSTLLTHAGSPDLSSLVQHRIDGFGDAGSVLAYQNLDHKTQTPVRKERQTPAHRRGSLRTAQDIDIGTLLFNYVRVLASDRRNVALALLGVLVVFFGINARPVASDVHTLPQQFVQGSISTATITVTQTQQAVVTSMSTVQLERVHFGETHSSVPARSSSRGTPSAKLMEADHPGLNVGGDRDMSVPSQVAQETIFNGPGSSLGIGQPTLTTLIHLTTESTTPIISEDVSPSD